VLGFVLAVTLTFAEPTTSIDCGAAMLEQQSSAGGSATARRRLLLLLMLLLVQPTSKSSGCNHLDVAPAQSASGVSNRYGGSLGEAKTQPV